MNKRKIAIKHITASVKQKRILNLINDSPEGLSPKYISNITKINVNTVRTILRKLEIEGKVKRKSGLRGFYISVDNSIHPLNFYNMHNVQLQCEDERILSSNHDIITNNFDGIIKFRIEVGKKSHKATMSISSEYPFNTSALTILGYLFQKEIERKFNFTPSTKDIIIRSLELNKDDYSIDLLGVNCITLDSWISQYKLYQKRNRVREEYKIKVPISFETINELLKQGISTTYVSQRLDNLEKTQSKIQNDLKKFYYELKRMLKQ